MKRDRYRSCNVDLQKMEQAPLQYAARIQTKLPFHIYRTVLRYTFSGLLSE